MNKKEIIEIMEAYIEEMEGYAYFGSNKGIPVGEIEEIAEEITGDE